MGKSSNLTKLVKYKFVGKIERKNVPMANKYYEKFKSKDINVINKYYNILKGKNILDAMFGFDDERISKFAAVKRILIEYQETLNQ